METKASLIFQDHPTEGVKIHVEFSPPILSGDDLTYAQKMAVGLFNYIVEDHAAKRDAEEAESGPKIIV